MDDRKYFVLSAFISLGIYFLFIFVFLFNALNDNVKKIDAISKNTVLQLDIVLDQPKVEKPQIVQSQIQSSKEAQEVVKKTTSSSAKQKSDLKSLFADVSTKAPAVVKQTVTNTQKSTVSSRFKSQFEKEKKTKDITVNKLQNKTVTASKQVSSESKNDSDPYYSKIYDIMYQRWNPMVFDADSKARVLITISSNGDFSFSFIQYSDNISFDNQLKNFLTGQLNEKFPVNPNGKTTQIEILFQAKG